MSDRYEHLLYHRHHVSAKRKTMSNDERAAQFGAFQALTGYEEGIEETARFVNARPVLTDDEQAALNQAFLQLTEQHQPLITVTYFVPDAYKEGGEYASCTGYFRFLDMQLQQLKMIDGTAILLEDICRLQMYSAAVKG